MLVGTNNFNCTAEQIAEGIMELVRMIREKQPDAYIVLPVNLLLHLQISDLLSVEQKSIGLKFSKSRTGSDVRYICQHNLSHFTFPIFGHSLRFSVFHSLQSITPHIY